jgi:hypothetical protein
VTTTGPALWRMYATAIGEGPAHDVTGALALTVPA